MKITVKQIAEMAGVSAGTVDRVLHNRGNVAEKSREKVAEVLEKVGYVYNVHSAAVPLKKKFVIAVITPAAETGDYWSCIHEGIDNACKEYSDMDISIGMFPYDKFDPDSFAAAAEALVAASPSAVVFGPAFRELSIDLCGRLDSEKIPYVFVDDSISGTNPIYTISADQKSCGSLIAKLMDRFTPEGRSILLVKFTSPVFEALNQNAREDAAREYLSLNDPSRKLVCVTMCPGDSRSDKAEVKRILEANPDVGGIAVLSSRGHIIADAVRALGAGNPVVSSFDLTSRNGECLRNGSIEFVLCQNPVLQGYTAIGKIIFYLIYRKKTEAETRLIPAQIIFRENFPDGEIR